MSRRVQLLIIALIAITSASLVSHGIARIIGFRTEAVEPLVFGAKEIPIGATAAGSSLMFYGINWSDVSKVLGVRVRGWAVPGGSLEEMDVLHRAAPPASITFLDVSINDFNENYLSEFRANVVPLRETVTNLLASGASVAHVKRMLSQYPLKYVRVLFPSAGRSTHVMVGIREAFRSLRGRRPAEPSDRAVVASESNGHTENITQWEPARLQRQLGDLRGGLTATFDYHGPKSAALTRFLRRGTAQGKMIVVVLPESPAFTRGLITDATRQKFEAVLADARARNPDVIWVRLDQAPELRSDTNYWDLVHLNAPGQALATRLLLAQLKNSGIVPK